MNKTQIFAMIAGLFKRLAGILVKTILWIMLILAIIYGGFYLYIHNAIFNSKEFNSEEWKAGEYHYIEDRCGMYDNLVSNYLRKGMTQEEVENLLGKGRLFYYCENNKAKCISYMIGNMLFYWLS